MLSNLKAQPADKILTLMAAYREDPRPAKVDLGVGVYKNAEGVTPVMRAVKEAERRLVETQESKSYVALAGDPAYADVMDGKLYVFLSEEIFKAYQKDKAGTIAKAEANWKKIQNTKATEL